MSQNITIKIDLDAPVTFASVIEALRGFFCWWGAELLEFIPHSWQERLHAGSVRPTLIITDDGWSLEYPGRTAIALDPRTPAYELRDELLRRAPDSLRRSFDVILPRQDVLFKRQTLPSAAAIRLKQVVRLQLDRLSPFRGDDVQFDCWLVLQDSDTSRISPAGDNVSVDIAIIPKRRLTAIESAIRAVGMVPRSFKLADCPASFTPVGLPWTKQTQYRAMISVLGIFLIAAAIILSPILRGWEITDLRTQIDTVGPQVERAQAERDELDHYQLPAQAISSDRATALDVLLDLTRRLPDSVSLSRLQITGQQVTIEGRSTTSMDMRAIMARSPLLTNVRSVGMMPSNSRFSLTATLKPGISREL